MINNKEIPIGDLRFDCRVSGDSKDKLVILLHGFPETSFMWRDTMKDLAAAGFYCLAPNMRGYSKNACPRGKNNYTLEKLSQDVIALAKAEGKKTFHLIAHDWGAVIGWYLAYHHSEIISSYTSLSVPHIKGYMKALKTDKDQQNRSKYIRLLIIPFLAEYTIRKNDFGLFRKFWKHSSEKEVADYLTVFREKRSLTASLNYYRANFGKRGMEYPGEIHVPTLFIWGNRDVAIGARGVSEGHQYCKGPYTYLELDAGHWLIQTKYPEIRPAILEHLRKYAN
jgi:pimeloyl-ACP methyl ester carboxylesterase